MSNGLQSLKTTALSAKILVIEDGRTQALRMMTVLANAGFDVKTASTGEQGLQTFIEFGPDIILMDLQLPDTDGREVAHRIRALPAGSDVSILFMTAVFRETADIVQGLNVGADEYLVKPVQDDELVARVSAVLRIRSAYRATAIMARRLIAVNQLSRRVAAILEPEPLVAFIIESLQREFNFPHAHVIKLEGKQLTVLGGSFPALIGQSFAVESGRSLSGAALAEDRVIRSGEPAVMNLQPLVPSAPFALAIPYHSAEGGRGCIEVSGPSALEVGDSDLLLLQTLADIMVVAMDNARLYRAMKELATRDELTGLFNRRQILSLLDSEISRAQRYSRDLAVVMMDLDHFKSINDTHGHAMGDSALKSLANRLMEEVRTQDLMGRLGGDEFVIVLPETNAQGAKELCMRLLASCRKHPIQDSSGKDFFLTISVGYAELKLGNKTDSVELLKNADQELLRAKRSGRNTLSG